MEFKIKTMPAFKIIGFERTFRNDNSYQTVPKFWDEIREKYFKNIMNEDMPKTAIEKAIIDNSIGEYGVCIDDVSSNTFRYLIAGNYIGKEIPDGLVIYEFEALNWAIFDCYGPLPKALQEVNTYVFKDWLPNNKEYEFYGNFNIEWYDLGDPNSDDYHSAIWIPIKKK